MAPTALVTGATGFLGSRLVPTLVAEGWAVRACGRRPRPAELSPDVDYHVVDLAGDAPLSALVDGVTHVFHLAGASSSKSSDEEMERDNVWATRRLVGSLPAGRLERFVHMSSTSVYGEEDTLPSPITEDVRPRPSRGYGKAKWRAEEVVWAAAADGSPVVVLRPVSVYGPGNVKLLASAILDSAIEAFGGAGSLPVPSRPIEQRLVHIDDLLAATVHVAGAAGATGRAFNVVDDHYPSSHQVAGWLADAFGMELQLHESPDCGPGYEERARLHRAMVDQGMRPEILLTTERLRFMRKGNRNNRLSTAALVGTGFRFGPTDMPRAVAATIDWYRQQRWVL